ncbi:hypothetical protein ABPG72_013560 [Tetrahymena utriculariae]
MNSKFFGIQISNNKNFEEIPQLIFSNYQCKIVNNILQVELTQRFQDQNISDSQLNSQHSSNEAIYYLPINQNICLESFQATINGKTTKGVVKKINEAKNLYQRGLEEGNVVGYCEKKIFQREVGECLEIKLGNIPEKFCIDIKLKYSQQLCVILNTFYQVDLSLVLKESNEQINQNSFILDLLCSQKINFYKNFGVAVNVQQVDENHTAFYTNQLQRSQKQLLQEGINIVQFKLIYQFENMHIPQVLYGACESLVHIMKDDQSNKQVDVQNNSFMISFIPDFNQKFKSQINDAVVQSIEQNQNIFSEEYLNSFNQQMIDQTGSSKCEFVFLLDRSGSMSGQSIQNAIEALILFIKSLPTDSYFNIYSFGSQFSKLFEESQKYSNENVEFALAEVETYTANYGGTNLYEPLNDIFNQKFVKGYGRQIYILTDGQIEKKENVMHLIQSNNISNRVHAIGIGQYVDKDLVIQSATSGKGYHVLVTDQTLIQSSIINILQNSISPILEDSGIQLDSLNEEDKSVKISYFDTSINQNIEKILILEPQDAHKYDSDLNKTVFKLGIHQKLCQLSNILKTKNQILSQEEHILQLVNESIEHQILTSYTSYFCEIEQITDEKRVQYFVEKYQPQNNPKIEVQYCRNKLNRKKKTQNSTICDKFCPQSSLETSRGKSRDRERDKKRKLSDDDDDDDDQNKKTNESKYLSSNYKESMSTQNNNNVYHQRSFNQNQNSYYCFYGYNSKQDNFNNQKAGLVNMQSNLQIDSFSQDHSQKKGCLDLQNIIKQVTVEGMWRFNQQIVSEITNCTNETLEDTIKLFQQKDFFMTILMIWVLENYFQKEKQQWQMIVNKSNKFMQQQITDHQQLEQLKQKVSKICKIPLA